MKQKTYKKSLISNFIKLVSFLSCRYDTKDRTFDLALQIYYIYEQKKATDLQAINYMEQFIEYRKEYDEFSGDDSSGSGYGIFTIAFLSLLTKSRLNTQRKRQ